MAKMLQILLTCTFLPGLGVLSSGTFRVYHLSNEPRTWSGAQTFCRNKHKDLVSISSMKEYRDVLAELNETRVYWTALTWHGNKGGGWRWSLAEPGAYTTTENQANYTNWNSWPPAKKGKNCILQLPGGKWQEDHCGNERCFICYDGEESPARYIEIKKGLNWKAAQNYCRKHHTDLASARNQAENEAIAKVWTGEGAWIGLIRDKWKWSDGSPSSFRWWGDQDFKKQPKTMYAAIIRSRKMAAANKQDEFHCICYSDHPDVPQISTVSPIIPTSATDSHVSTAPSFVSSSSVPKRNKQVLTLKVTVEGAAVDDRAMKDAILEQVKDKLKQRGVSADLKLTWKKNPDGKIFKKTEL